MPQWALTEAEYKRVNFPFDIPLDYFKELNFEKNCKNPYTNEWYKELKEIILTMKRVKHGDKEYLVTTRQRISNNSEGEPQTCPLPDVEVWFKPNFKTKLETNPQTKHKETKVVGVSRPEVIYTKEFNTVEATELYNTLADKERIKFYIQHHGMQEIEMFVPLADLFLNYDFDYLYDRAWLNDPKFASLARRERVREAIALQGKGLEVSAQNRTVAEGSGAMVGISKTEDLYRPPEVGIDVDQQIRAKGKGTK